MFKSCGLIRDEFKPLVVSAKHTKERKVSLVVGCWQGSGSDAFGRWLSSPKRVKATFDGSALFDLGSITITLLASSSFSCHRRSRASGLLDRIRLGRERFWSLSSLTSLPKATFFTWETKTIIRIRYRRKLLQVKMNVPLCA